jgi:hypothetical protein
LDILQAIYTRLEKDAAYAFRSSYTKTITVIGQKKSDLSALSTPENLEPHNAVTYAIENSIFKDSLTSTHRKGCTNCGSRNRVGHPPVDYTQKLVETILGLAGDGPATSDYYSKFYEHLSTKMDDTILGARVGVSSHVWRAANLVIPSITVVLSGVQVYLGGSRRPQPEIRQNKLERVSLIFCIMEPSQAPHHL